MMNKFTLSICAVILLFSSCTRAHTEEEHGDDGIPTTKNIEAHIRSNEQGSYEFYENGHKYKAFLFTDNSARKPTGFSRGVNCALSL